jgi:hypothetical protein
MRTGTGPPGNPYLGPRAFTSGDRGRFFGRVIVAREVEQLLLTERILLLHSSAGAGKSSLIQASLIPRLQEEGFDIKPVLRVNGDVADRRMNRYVRSVIECLEAKSQAKGKLSILVADVAARFQSTTLSQYLEQSAQPSPAAGDSVAMPCPELLVFDQFEEIITTDPSAYDERLEFFRQLGDALRPRHRWALFAMREEYVAALDPYVQYVSDAMGTRFSLPLLDEQNAREAIEKPALRAVPEDIKKSAKEPVKSEVGPPAVAYQKEAVDLLIENLQTIARDDGSKVRDRWIEPLHLQVACSALWSKLPAEARNVTIDDVKKVGDVDEALANYYAEKVHDAAVEADIPEAKIRIWIETKLITRNVRAQVLKGSELQEGVTPLAANWLDRTFIIRQETRRRSEWYELAHDRLMRPIKQDNARWFLAQGSGRLHQLAELWVDQGRPEDALLRGSALGDAKRFLRDQPDSATPALTEFVRLSVKQSRLTALQAAVFPTVLAGLFGLASFFEQQNDAARLLARDAETQDTIAVLAENARLATRELGWGLPRSQQAGPTLARSLRADTLIQKVAKAPSSDTVIYYAKPSDPVTVQGALHNIGFLVDVERAYSDASTVNAIAYSPNTTAESIRLVALALVRSGATIRSICPPTRGTRDSHIIQVYSAGRSARKPAITLEQIQSLTASSRSVNCGEQLQPAGGSSQSR